MKIIILTALAVLSGSLAATAAPLEKCDKGPTNKRLACLEKNIQSLSNNVQIKSVMDGQTRCIHNSSNVGINATLCDGSQGPVNWQLVPQ